MTLRRLATIAFVAALMASAATPATASAVDDPNGVDMLRAVAEPERRAAARQHGGTATPDEVTATAIKTCLFFSAGDRAHVSSAPPPTISVHGWWVNGDCPKGTKAVVTTQLQKKNVLGLWVNVGSQGVKTVYAGGGSANRSNSRYTCSGTQAHQFRSWIDVDIVGFPDDPTKLYTAERTLNCN